MKYFILFHAIILVQARCRSLLPAANMDEPGKLWNTQTAGIKEEESDLSLIESTDLYVPANFAAAETEPIERKIWDNSKELKPFIVMQARKLEKLLSEFAEKSGNSNDYATRAGQSLKQLKIILKEISSEGHGKSNNIDVKSKTVESSSTAKNSPDVFSLDGDLGFFYQDTQDLPTKFEDPLTLTFSHAKTIEEEIIGNNKNEDDQLDDMLIAAQNQIARIRKYFDVICRKHHHSMRVLPLEMEHNQTNSDVNQPKKLSMP